MGDNCAQLRGAIGKFNTRFHPCCGVGPHHQARLIELLAQLAEERHLDGGAGLEGLNQSVFTVMNKAIGGYPPSIAAFFGSNH